MRIVNPLFPATWSGLHISFLTPSILESSLHVIASIFPQPHLPFPLLISVGKIQIFSICFFYSSVVLDSSEGRSSQPLIDGSDFLEALTKKVDNWQQNIKNLLWIITGDVKRYLGQVQSFHGPHIMVWTRCGQELVRRESSRWDPMRGSWFVWLQSFQTARLEGLLDSLYKEPESLPEQEVGAYVNLERYLFCHRWETQLQQVRFAELLDQKLERAEVIIFNLLRKAWCDIQLGF